MRLTVHAKALHRAVEILGGKDQLRELLCVPMRDLEGWMGGLERPPMDVFLAAVDVISAAPASRRESGLLRTSANLRRDRAIEIREAILAAKAEQPRALAGASPLEFLEREFEPSEGRAMVEAALDAAISAARADRGVLQLAAPEGLRIVAYKGFRQPFLDYFALVNDDVSACGRALKQRKRVIIADIAADPVFAGTPDAGVLAEARVRAVQSTPLLDSWEEPLGVLSTHCAEPRLPNERELDVIDHIARRAAFWLEGGAL
jgi:GAF domain-containing protein